MKKRVLWGGVALLAVVGAVFYFRGGGGAEDGPYETLTVSRGALTEVAAATGSIEPRTQVQVQSRSSGEVIEVLVVEGQEVESGTVLIRLDPEDAQRAVETAESERRRVAAQISESRASLRVAELEVVEAENDGSISAQGAAMGLLAGQSARDAAHAVNVAVAQRDLRRAQLRATRELLGAANVNVSNAERNLAETEVRAPMSGTVLSLDVEAGTMVSSVLTNIGTGSNLLTLADLTELRVKGAISEAQVGDVAIGQAVVVRVDAYPDRTFAGRVAFISPLGRTESNVVTFDVEIDIVDEAAGLLRSGMSADLEIVTAEREGVLLLPLTALMSEGGERRVRMRDGELRTVRTGATDGERVVIEDGLEEGDVIRSVASTPNQDEPSRGGGLFGGRRRR